MKKLFTIALLLSAQSLFCAQADVKMKDESTENVEFGPDEVQLAPQRPMVKRAFTQSTLRNNYKSLQELNKDMAKLLNDKVAQVVPTDKTMTKQDKKRKLNSEVDGFKNRNNALYQANYIRLNNEKDFNALDAMQKQVAADLAFENLVEEIRSTLESKYIGSSCTIL